MALTTTALRPTLNRMLEAIKPGAKLPEHITDDRLIETLTMLLDAIAPPDDDGDDPLDIPLLGDVDALEMGAAVRSRGSGHVRKADVGRAKFFMTHGYYPPR